MDLSDHNANKDDIETGNDIPILAAPSPPIMQEKIKQLREQLVAENEKSIQLKKAYKQKRDHDLAIIKELKLEDQHLDEEIEKQKNTYELAKRGLKESISEVKKLDKLYENQKKEYYDCLAAFIEETISENDIFALAAESDDMFKVRDMNVVSVDDSFRLLLKIAEGEKRIKTGRILAAKLKKLLDRWDAEELAGADQELENKKGIAENDDGIERDDPSLKTLKK